MRSWTQFGALAALGIAMAVAAPAQDHAPVVWKKVPMALLRVDDEPPKVWQVYRAEKRKQALLVQIGGRFLMLDVESRRVYELAPRTLTRKDESTVEWSDPGEPAQAPPVAAAGTTPSTAKDRDAPKQLLPSQDWTMRDVGPMMRLRFRLTVEGRSFDVQIPIQPDLRQFY